jgi:hypothetical protein
LIFPDEGWIKMGTTVINRDSKAGVLWLARASTTSAFLLAILVRWLVTPDGSQYYVALATAWHLPGYMLITTVACAIGFGCSVTALGTILYYTMSIPVGSRGVVRMLEIAVLLLMAIFSVVECILPLIEYIFW